MGEVTVNTDGAACKTADALIYIEKTESRGKLGQKRKQFFVDLEIMKRNFKILIRTLLMSAIILALIDVFIKDDEIRKILEYVGLAIITAVFLNLILFLIKPEFFKNKSTREEIEAKVFEREKEKRDNSLN